ncbi:MAG: DUF5665 domain-containing protein [Bacteroidota bacterium]
MTPSEQVDEQRRDRDEGVRDQGEREQAREQAQEQALRPATDKAGAALMVQMERLADALERSSLAELVELYRRPRRMLLLSLAGGVMRGIGTALGFTAVAALVIYLLGRLASLNLPVIGEFIADIARIVERELQLRPSGL